MSNPLLDDLARTQEPSALILAIPTLGRFYEPGILADGADPTAMEIHPLGIAAEVHLNDPLLLASGKAVPKLVGAICPAVLDPERLCGIDIDAILMASRIASHGEKMKMESVCQHEGCENNDDIEINLQDIILRYAPIEDDQMGKFMVPIPELNQVVCTQPTTYQTGLEVIRSTVAIQKSLSQLGNVVFEDFIQDEDMMQMYLNAAEQNTVMSIATLVDSIFYVETSTGQRVIDKEAITEWAMRLKREHLNGVREKIQSLNEEVEKISHIEYECSACKKKNTIRLTLDPQKLFFYDPEGSETTAMSKTTSRKSGKSRRTPSRTSQR